MRKIIMTVVLLAIFSPLTASQTENTCVCPQVWEPVCGTDGKTYSNTCTAKCAKIDVLQKGQCKKNLCSFSEKTFRITSSAFHDIGEIPIQYTCQGDNISPPLFWTKPLGEVKSYVLIVIDYDAKKTVGHPMVHWIAYDILPTTHFLEVGAQNVLQGLNGYEKPAYAGMCPPKGPAHYYHFDLYAVKVSHLPLPPNPTIEQVLDALRTNVIAKTSMVGTYQRK